LESLEELGFIIVMGVFEAEEFDSPGSDIDGIRF
jgi:hypothetical protein